VYTAIAFCLALGMW